MTPEELKKVEADKNYQPKDQKIKPRILVDVNRVREKAGLPPITENPVVTDVPMIETTNFTPWGFRIPFTTKTKSTEQRKGFRYEEGQAPASRSAASPAKAGSQPQVVRTGTFRGKRVVMYSDGRMVYAPN